MPGRMRCSWVSLKFATTNKLLRRRRQREQLRAGHDVFADLRRNGCRRSPRTARGSPCAQGCSWPAPVAPPAPSSRASACCSCAVSTAIWSLAAVSCSMATFSMAAALRLSVTAKSLDCCDAHPCARKAFERSASWAVRSRSAAAFARAAVAAAGWSAVARSGPAAWRPRRGLRRRGLGLHRACAPVGRVQFDQRIARMHTLVVADENRGDVAVDARAEHRDVALDISVVGAFDPTPFGEPPVSGDHRQRAAPTARAECRTSGGVTGATAARCGFPRSRLPDLAGPGWRSFLAPALNRSVQEPGWPRR